MTNIQFGYGLIVAMLIFGFFLIRKEWRRPVVMNKKMKEWMKK